MHISGIITLTAGLCFCSVVADTESFKDEQQRYPRVRTARANTQREIDSLFFRAGVSYPPEAMFLRAFKYERIMELWAKSDDSTDFRLITEYHFTAFSGQMGPKRRQGDLQIPEGFYHIDRFNPASNFLLSLGLNYPNKSDRIRKSADDPGGDIFIHGNRVTIGCIPIGDCKIEELYIIAVDTRSGGQTKIPVHIFPCQLDNKKIFESVLADYRQFKSFWEEIYEGYSFFEKHRRLPNTRIDSTGKYNLIE